MEKEKFFVWKRMQQILLLIDDVDVNNIQDGSPCNSSISRGGNSRRTSGISDGIYIPAGRMIFKNCKNVRRRNFRQKQTEQV